MNNNNIYDYNPGTGQIITEDRVSLGFMPQVFAWMFLGLMLTGAIALGVSLLPMSILQFIYNPFVIFPLFIGELILVWKLSASAHKLATPVAGAMFLFYSALNGVTLSIIVLAYTGASLASTFFVTAGTFGAVALLGWISPVSLRGMRTFLFMGLIGIILASIVNIFLSSPMIYWIITYAGIIVFTGLTAYDTNMLRQLAASGRGTSQLAIVGALKLYLDFINLFLFMLRIMGNRR